MLDACDSAPELLSASFCGRAYVGFKHMQCVCRVNHDQVCALEDDVSGSTIKAYGEPNLDARLAAHVDTAVGTRWESDEALATPPTHGAKTLHGIMCQTDDFSRNSVA